MNFIFFGGGGLEKLIFLGYEDSVDIFLGSSQNGLYSGVISMHILVSFLRSIYSVGDIFWGWLNFKIFLWGCLKFLIFFCVNGRCWARADVRRKIKVPHGPLFRSLLFIDIY